MLRMLGPSLAFGQQILQNGVLGAILTVEPHQTEDQNRKHHHTSHAPSVNFATAKINTTIVDKIAQRD